jgi:hypothetical protein
MIFWFNSNIPNKGYQTNAEVISVNTSTQEVLTSSRSNAQSQFQALTPQTPLPSTCNYPLDISDIFPYWLKKESYGISASLISFTKLYYNWLVCENSDVNTVGFLNMESIKDPETMPDAYVKHLSNTYLNSIPTSSINYPGYSDGAVDQSKIRSLIDNVKVNLYSRKGTDSSYKLVINELFDVHTDSVVISYPKTFVMRLNGGMYDWMTDGVTSSTDTQTLFKPEMTSSYLNFSVLYDGNLWQDYSYVVNSSGVSADAYNRVIRPLLHPAGTLDFFEIRQDIFNNHNDVFETDKHEIPQIENYLGYTLGSTTSLAVCSGGTEPIYTFPYWDKEISAYPGISFGNINIADFLLLSPAAGYTYLNETRAGITC